ncbi:unnamed protein product [Polarella glacialis]|uniref:Uncharacterized protein n=1 Tax=Polarella glacialis TaxID=89957 RepID=A0A813DR45_POLGL|nr:unnamed protein product [Polarella glacialis]
MFIGRMFSHLVILPPFGLCPYGAKNIFLDRRHATRPVASKQKHSNSQPKTASSSAESLGALRSASASILWTLDFGPHVSGPGMIWQRRPWGASNDFGNGGDATSHRHEGPDHPMRDLHPQQ